VHFAGVLGRTHHEEPLLTGGVVGPHGGDTHLAEPSPDERESVTGCGSSVEHARELLGGLRAV
jgi:hypothetical protein